MATDAPPRFQTNRLVSPGEVLAEELEARGMSRVALSKAMGKPVRVVHEIVQGKKILSAEIALLLERVLEIPAESWLNLENMYQIGLARSKRSEGT